MKCEFSCDICVQNFHTEIFRGTFARHFRTKQMHHSGRYRNPFLTILVDKKNSEFSYGNFQGYFCTPISYETDASFWRIQKPNSGSTCRQKKSEFSYRNFQGYFCTSSSYENFWGYLLGLRNRLAPSRLEFLGMNFFSYTKNSYLGHLTSFSNIFPV